MDDLKKILASEPARIIPELINRVAALEENQPILDNQQSGATRDQSYIGSDVAAAPNVVEVVTDVQPTLDGPGGKPTGEITLTLQKIKAKKFGAETDSEPFNLFPDTLTVVTDIQFDTAGNIVKLYTQQIRCVKVGDQIGPATIATLEAYPAAGD